MTEIYDIYFLFIIIFYMYNRCLVASLLWPILVVLWCAGWWLVYIENKECKEIDNDTN